MEMEDARGKLIHSFGYDPETKTLTIKFHAGGVYHYDDVPPTVIQELRGAPSHGKHFHEKIRGRFTHRQV